MAAGAASDAAKAMALHWRMPPPAESLLDLAEKAHPLHVYNSLTRSKVRSSLWLRR
jgi:hypothetical protein